MRKSIVNISLIALLAGCATATVPLNSNQANEDLNSEFFDGEYVADKKVNVDIEQLETNTKTTAEKIAEEAKKDASKKVEKVSSEVDKAMDTAVYKGTPTATYKVGDPYKIDGVWYFPYEDYYYAEVGQASWYGSEDNGNFTANGEVFDSSALTAAHRTLPMPSVVRVTNVSNGKSVVVKVNDRGPFARDRIIDLSQAAAERLDFVKDGHSTVKVEILPEESKALKAELLNKGTAKAPVVEMQVEDKVVEQPKVSEPVSFEQHTPVVEEVKKPVSPVMNTDHYVQMGAFGNHMNADALARRLSDAGHNVVTEKTASGLTKVKVVGFDSKAAAKSMINTLQNQGFGKGFAR